VVLNGITIMTRNKDKCIGSLPASYAIPSHGIESMRLSHSVRTNYLVSSMQPT